MKKLLIILSFSILLSACTLNQSSTETETQKVEQKEQTNDSFKGSLFDAVKLGKGMKCTYTIDGNQYEGYVKGKQYRGKITSQGQVSEVIMKDDCMWSWSQSTPQGMKVCYSPEEADSSLWGQEDSNAEGEGNSEASYTAPDIEYECHQETISDERFNPPTDIQFMNFDTMMQMGN